MNNPNLPYFFRRPLLLVLAGYILVLMMVRLWQNPVFRTPTGPFEVAGSEKVTLRGKVANDPVRQERGGQFFLKVREMKISEDGFFASPRGQVRVHISDPAFPVRWGDQVSVTGKLRPLPPLKVPGAFDYASYLAKRGVTSQMFVPGRKAHILDQAPFWSPVGFMGALRRKVLQTFETHLSPHSAALLSGVLLGKKPRGFAQMEEDFRRSGTYHLLVASGSNVGFVILLWFVFGRWVLFLSRRVLWTVAPFFAFLYAGVAGADPPVMRAAVMVTLGIIGFVMAREDRAIHAVGFSALVLLIFQPQALFSAGFLMSYAATTGIILLVPPWEKALKKWVPPVFKKTTG